MRAGIEGEGANSKIKRLSMMYESKFIVLYR